MAVDRNVDQKQLARAARIRGHAYNAGRATRGISSALVYLQGEGANTQNAARLLAALRAELDSIAVRG